jgi:hypothetical protein
MIKTIAQILILFPFILFCQTQKSFNQPERVFIQSSATAPNFVQNTKEVVLIYLEDAMGDTEGELLLQVKFKGNYDELLGKIFYPPADQNWYFYAEWNMTTKGGGFLFYSIDQKKYNKLISSFYNDLN